MVSCTIFQGLSNGVYHLPFGKWPEYVANRRAARNASIANRQPIYDYLGAEYCVIATVGTPGTKFKALLDTSSAISWVPSSLCGNKPKNCPNYCKGQYCEYLCEEDCCQGSDAIGCRNKTKFDTKKSSTYSASYGDFIHYTTIGMVEGKYGNDIWSIGTHNQSSLTLSKYRFGLVTHLGETYQHHALDGVFGLGRSQNPKSFIVQAIEENLLDEPFVSLYLKDEGYSQNGKVAGSVTFGGVDNDNCGVILDFVPLTSNTKWEFRLNGVDLNGHKANGGVALSDTGSAYIHGPYFSIYLFAQDIGARYEYLNDRYIIACDKQFKFSLDIGRHTYTINSTLLIKEISPNKCELMVRENDSWDEYSWILGVPFANAYCQIYDYTGKVGFALIH
ncbi:unnamed protein product [Bursaphelenchus xylophilus]|uniref:(pine wood nematode) hypothetical protein n=1 Tax=Bursaphelenchus xylophilus TaxID=6326 RepID=A0A1I7RM87_BURXY|nr:unnamed protein product [Bursaphelenchus xylophilus]CAG9118293.1 unnamed protein product [Bursaphelenchus xylophilus]